jgi:hypothetical protein
MEDQVKARHSSGSIWAAIFMIPAALLSGCGPEVSAPAPLCSYLPQPAVPMTDQRPLAQEAALRKCEIEHYVAQRYLALGYDVVATTELPSGDIMDWISAESVPGSDQPPPPPISPDEYHPRPGAQLGKTELQMYPELRGPVGTIGFHRPTFPAYVNGETDESSLEEILQRPEQPGEVPEGTDRMYAGYRLQRYNHGATTVVNAFGGVIDAYAFSLLEMAVWCDGPDPATTREQIGIAASRDNINFYHSDSATRVQVEYVAAGDDKSQSGWHGAKALKSAFIPIPDSSAHPGDRIPESIIGGTQFEQLFKIVLWEGNWWVGYGFDWMGYYPFYLFDQIVGYACWMAFYGEVYTLYPKSSPSSAWTTADMGSSVFGHLGYFGNAAYFRQMSYFDTANVTHFMFKTDALPTGSQWDDCYTASVLIVGPDGDYAFYCGGPGNDAANADKCQ